MGVINIFGKIFLRGFNIDLSRLNKRIKADFKKMRQELEEHLQAINENTNEISANYEYVCGIERKIDKMMERIDEIQMHLEANSSGSGQNFSSKSCNFDVEKLNKKEQEVFLIIYTMEEEKGCVSYRDIAEKLAISEHLAGSYVTSLIEKGVPIIKRYVGSTPYLSLNTEFKTLQTKENILQLSLQEFGF